MRKLIAGILATMGIGAPAVQAKEAPQADATVTRELRAKALALKAEEIGVSRASFPKVWGLLMETGFENGAFSLVVLGDGTTSLYFSTGGGIIGAGEQQAVREASTKLLAEANRFVSAATPTDEYPLPSNGRVMFYFLSYDGVLSYAGVENELGEGRDKLSALFAASHEVISRVRQVEESRR